jgi:hypothetical protein
MSNFFNIKINQNKIYIYLLVSKINKNLISTKILITKCLLLHDYSYLINNFESIICDSEKVMYSLVLNYNFNEQNDFPKYPYDIFYLNRVLLHSFLFFCEKNTFFLNFKENLESKSDNTKIHFISNINYLKRIKDWSLNWKKNNFSIDKYQKPLELHSQKNISYHDYLNQNNNNLNENDNENEFIFSMNTLCKHYFDFKESSTTHCKNIEKNEINKFSFNCNYSNNNLFEKITERPNTDLLNKCIEYFEQKYIKYL